MDGARFDTLARSLIAIGSRRRALTAALGGSLGLLSLDRRDEAAARKKACPPCKKRKKGKCKKRLPDGTACAGGSCQAGSCVAATPPPSPRLVYECPEPSSVANLNGNGSDRFAQTFIPSESGSLHQIRFAVSKQGTAGDYVVQLLAVSGGTPGSSAGDILSTTTVSDASLPAGLGTVVADFSGPALTAGTEFAAAITRPGSTSLDVRQKVAGGCTGTAFTATSSGAFTTKAPVDIIVEVLVV